MRFLKFFSILALATVLTLTSCKKHDDEQENINTIRLSLDGKVFTWSDTDGSGGNAPKIDTIKLSPNMAASDYKIEVLDGSVNPAKDYTAEIVEESNSHLFVLTVSGANLTLSNLSTDKGGKTFGQTGKMATGAASTGSLRIILKHEPDKSSANPSNTGETDADVILPIAIR
jgi:hypothetical protein